MASVTPAKRAEGYAWRVQARDENRKMRQETFCGEDPVVVEKAARDFARLVDRVGVTEARRIRDEREGAARRDSPTLAAWAAEYLDKAGGKSRGANDGTRAGYRAILDATILPRLGELPVDSITADDVSAWVTWLEEQPSKRNPERTVAAKTVKNHHGLLSQLLGAAADRGLRTGNPARGIKPTRQRRERMTVLTPAEFATVLYFIPEPSKPLVEWLAGTGMRWSEATALLWGDIDRSAGDGFTLAHVNKAWQKGPNGKGRLGPPKTDAGERSISVPTELVASLGTPGKATARVFNARRGGVVWPGPFHTRVWGPALAAARDAEACEAAKLQPIEKRPRIHDLRHSHVSWLIAAGRPLPYIQSRIGHEKITTTIDVYGHLLPEAHQDDAAAVAAALGYSPTPPPESHS